MTNKNWHAQSANDVFTALEGSPEGLSPGAAGERLARFGPNRLRPPKRRSPLARFLAQLDNVLIYVLLGSAVVTALMRDWVDAGVILGVVLLNALIGFIQEGKAEEAIDAIRSILTHQAAVLRGGRRLDLPAEELVPGDVVLLQSGDKVPADLRLFRVKDLRIDEAILTGESLPVDKQVETVDEGAGVADRRCLAYSGTLVTFGQASGVVIATGEATEIGRISALLAEVKPLQTRLLRQIGEFSQWLTGGILLLALGTLGFGVLVRDYSFAEMFFAAVALAVAAIPEGLPAIITITLALGVQRMARRQAIIRRLPAVETLGSVTVICTDKTGTLTRNEMTVQAVVTAADEYAVAGVGYSPFGSLSMAEGGAPVVVDEHHDLRELLQAAVLCNDGVLRQVDGQWQIQGDPTEGALLVLGVKGGLDPELLEREFPRSDVIPFESEHRYMATLHHDHSGHGFVYLKGAPERVLGMCSRQRRDGVDEPLDLPFWQERVERVAGLGQRTLAVAVKVTGAGRELGFADVEGGLTLLGLCGLIDPPRAEAITAVAECRAAGIRVKMITGDHALTACAIGARLGIGNGSDAATGETLNALDDEALGQMARRVDIFARVSPEHKLRLVEALQAGGEVTVMTGDGVNDAPALKRADVGVAMGCKGTEAAKEAAEMVLADDNFATIAHAVEEGRTVYENIRKTLVFALPTNGAQAGVIVAAVMAGTLLPLTPLQVLWVNMVTAVTLALALAFEPPESDVMRQLPRDPKAPLLQAFQVWRIAYVSVLQVIGTLGMFLWEELHGLPLEAARTLAVNTLIFCQCLYLFNCRFMSAPVLNRRGLLGSPHVLGAVALILTAQMLFTYAPFMQRIFGTAPITAADWGRASVFALVLFLVVEAEKGLLRRFRSRRTSALA